jgi:O-antigen/teichoic acid export membrane protein/glycosyltransferase involved in cell wall biosynthesis
MTTFSVVIAAYEAGTTLGNAIGSVLAQTRQDFEVIVVDDGSNDDTATVAARFATEDARVKLHRQPNEGPSAARNRGIALARGEYVSMLDSDDLWLPDYLAEMGQALERDAHAGLAYTDAWILEEASGRFLKATTATLRGHPSAPTLPHDKLVAELLQRNFVFNSVTVRRAVLEQVGGYDPRLSHAEDYELWLRIAISGFGVVRVAGPLAIWRDREDSLSEDQPAMVDGLRSVYRAVLERHPASPQVRALAEARLEEIGQAEDRLTRRRIRIYRRVRRAVASATRETRFRWRQRPSPPPSVVRAFPGLGIGRSAPPESAATAQELDTAQRPGETPPADDSDADVEPLASGPPRADPDAPPASLGGVVSRGIGLAGIGYVGSQALTFATYLALARLLRPADFGHFAAGSVVVGLGAVLGESGMLAALIQRRHDLEEALNSAFLATLAGGLLLTLVTLGAAPLVTLFFNSNEAGVVAAVMSGWMLLRLIAIVPDALLQRRFSFLRRVVIDPLSSVAFAAGSIPAAALGLGVWALVIGTYAAAVVTLVSPWAFARWRPRPRLASIGMWRELARFGRPVVVAHLILRAVEQIPVLALGRLRSPGVLGQFTYASRVAAQPLGAVINVGGYVLLPAFARLSAHDVRFRAAVRRALRWLCITSFPAGLLLVPLGTPAVVLVFGERWREAGYGAAALGVFCAARSLDSIASEAWKASGRPDMLPRMHGISLLLTVLFVGGLAPFGLVGVAIGMSLTAVGVGIYAIRGMSRALGIALGDLLHEVWPPAIAAAAMAGALYPLEHFVVHADRHGTVAGLALLALEALLGVIIYLAALSVLAPHSTTELADALRRRLRRSRETVREELGSVP